MIIEKNISALEYGEQEQNESIRKNITSIIPFNKNEQNEFSSKGEQSNHINQSQNQIITSTKKISTAHNTHGYVESVESSQRMLLDMTQGETIDNIHANYTANNGKNTNHKIEEPGSVIQSIKNTDLLKSKIAPKQNMIKPKIISRSAEVNQMAKPKNIFNTGHTFHYGKKEATDVAVGTPESRCDKLADKETCKSIKKSYSKYNALSFIKKGDVPLENKKNSLMKETPKSIAKRVGSAVSNKWGSASQMQIMKVEGITPTQMPCAPTEMNNGTNGDTVTAALANSNLCISNIAANNGHVAEENKCVPGNNTNPCDELPVAKNADPTCCQIPDHEEMETDKLISKIKSLQEKTNDSNKVTNKYLPFTTMELMKVKNFARKYSEPGNNLQVQSKLNSTSNLTSASLPNLKKNSVQAEAGVYERILNFSKNTKEKDLIKVPREKSNYLILKKVSPSATKDRYLRQTSKKTTMEEMAKNRYMKFGKSDSILPIKKNNDLKSFLMKQKSANYLSEMNRFEFDNGFSLNSASGVISTEKATKGSRSGTSIYTNYPNYSKHGNQEVVLNSMNLMKYQKLLQERSANRKTYETLPARNRAADKYLYKSADYDLSYSSNEQAVGKWQGDELRRRRRSNLHETTPTNYTPYSNALMKKKQTDTVSKTSAYKESSELSAPYFSKSLTKQIKKYEHMKEKKREQDEKYFNTKKSFTNSKRFSLESGTGTGTDTGTDTERKTLTLIPKESSSSKQNEHMSRTTSSTYGQKKEKSIENTKESQYIEISPPGSEKPRKVKHALKKMLHIKRRLKSGNLSLSRKANTNKEDTYEMEKEQSSGSSSDKRKMKNLTRSELRKKALSSKSIKKRYSNRSDEINSSRSGPEKGSFYNTPKKTRDDRNVKKHSLQPSRKEQLNKIYHEEAKKEIEHKKKSRHPFNLRDVKFTGTRMSEDVNSNDIQNYSPAKVSSSLKKIGLKSSRQINSVRQSMKFKQAAKPPIRSSAKMEKIRKIEDKSTRSHMKRKSENSTPGKRETEKLVDTKKKKTPDKKKEEIKTSKKSKATKKSSKTISNSLMTNELLFDEKKKKKRTASNLSPTRNKRKSGKTNSSKKETASISKKKHTKEKGTSKKRTKEKKKEPTTASTRRSDENDSESHSENKSSKNNNQAQEGHADASSSENEYTQRSSVHTASEKENIVSDSKEHSNTAKRKKGEQPKKKEKTSKVQSKNHASDTDSDLKSNKFSPNSNKQSNANSSHQSNSFSVSNSKSYSGRELTRGLTQNSNKSMVTGARTKQNSFTGRSISNASSAIDTQPTTNTKRKSEKESSSDEQSEEESSDRKAISEEKQKMAPAVKEKKRDDKFTNKQSSSSLEVSNRKSTIYSAQSISRKSSLVKKESKGENFSNRTEKIVARKNSLHKLEKEKENKKEKDSESSSYEFSDTDQDDSIYKNKNVKEQFCKQKSQSVKSSESISNKALTQTEKRQISTERISSNTQKSTPTTLKSSKRNSFAKVSKILTTTKQKSTENYILTQTSKQNSDLSNRNDLDKKKSTEYAQVEKGLLIKKIMLTKKNPSIISSVKEEKTASTIKENSGRDVKKIIPKVLKSALKSSSKFKLAVESEHSSEKETDDSQGFPPLNKEKTEHSEKQKSDEEEVQKEEPSKSFHKESSIIIINKNQTLASKSNATVNTLKNEKSMHFKSIISSKDQLSTPKNILKKSSIRSDLTQKQSEMRLTKFLLEPESEKNLYLQKQSKMSVEKNDSKEMLLKSAFSKQNALSKEQENLFAPPKKNNSTKSIEKTEKEEGNELMKTQNSSTTVQKRTLDLSSFSKSPKVKMKPKLPILNKRVVASDALIKKKSSKSDVESNT